MKKWWSVLLMSFAFAGCSSGGGDFGADLVFVDEQENILILVGEGGTSGSMFTRSAKTYQKENGGEIYETKNGDEFVAAVKDFVQKKGKIDHLEYFGHGNAVGLYVNQEPNVNGALYANDPDLNVNYVAGSIYELDQDIFAKNGWIRFNGCNVASGYPTEDTLAQRIANYFDVDMVAPTGPTEFSKNAYTVDPIDQSNFLSKNFDGDVYMVATYPEKGFVVVKPQEASDSGFTDVRKGQSFEEGVVELQKRGLKLSGNEVKIFAPYRNISYKEAQDFCKIALGKDANCYLSGYENEDKIRNLHALKMLVDAYGVELKNTNPWRDAYISWANENGILTKDFVTKKLYTRSEMAELTWKMMKKFGL